ncbi:DUF2848 family protein [Saccharopolyspora sp. WRP15-2]|uniref:DUF2848 family protein n=1 Tax=Saccharopolyspora oryzae TaxID=2997343 RepID=A0ABT4UQ76_9PSEU|nr:DUF2848 family protein [Saccharopolyspora oryzae]MDA3623870.1 DUF2848 family protein [Saccharopolyspora oryzae]
MIGATADVLTLEPLESREPLLFRDFHALIAGYTGRDEEAVRHHIEELAAIGVAPPERVPMFYPVAAESISTAASTPISAANTSGEVEPVIVRHSGKYFLGIGSDHTDREMETIDIGDSKRACPKPIGPVVVEVPDWESFDWDGCRARSWVDGEPYQDGTLANLRTPLDLLRIFDERAGDDGGDLICFAGTLPLLTGAFTPGTRWDLELVLPDGRKLTHTYRTTEGN